MVSSRNTFPWPLIATNSNDLRVLTVGIANLRSKSISVTIGQIPDNCSQSKITTEFVSCTAPNLFRINTPFLADWIHRGILADITDCLPAAKIPFVDLLPGAGEAAHQERPAQGPAQGLGHRLLLLQGGLHRQAEHHGAGIPHLDPDGSGSFIPFMQQLTVDRNGKNATSPTSTRAL